MSNNLLRPVFIGGVERSGTTLLGTILGSQVGCITTPESQFKSKLLNLSPFSIDSANNMLTDDIRFMLWNVKLKEIMYNISGIKLREYIDRIILHYNLQNLKIQNPKIWIDHTPGNFNIADNLFTEFPDAHFVHIIRDPRAVICSLINTDWGIITIERAISFWQKRMFAPQIIKNKLIESGRYHEIKYEEIINDPLNQIANLCDKLSINFNGKIDTSAFLVPEYTKMQHNLVNKSLNNKRINAWVTKLNEKQIAHIQYAIKDQIINLGYDLIVLNTNFSNSSKFYKDIKEKKYYQFFKKYLIDYLNRKKRIDKI